MCNLRYHYSPAACRISLLTHVANTSVVLFRLLKDNILIQIKLDNTRSHRILSEAHTNPRTVPYRTPPHPTLLYHTLPCTPPPPHTHTRTHAHAEIHTHCDYVPMYIII